MSYSFRLAARLLYAPSHIQDSTYHGLCYASRGALARTRKKNHWVHHEESIPRPIAPITNAQPRYCVRDAALKRNDLLQNKKRLQSFHYVCIYLLICSSISNKTVFNVQNSICEVNCTSHDILRIDSIFVFQ